MLVFIDTPQCGGLVDSEIEAVVARADTPQHRDQKRGFINKPLRK